MDIQKTVGKWKFRPPCRIAIPQTFILKFGIRDYVRNMTRRANIGTDRFGGGFPQYVKYNTFVTFYTVFTFFSILSIGQTAAHVNYVKCRQGAGSIFGPPLFSKTGSTGSCISVID